MVLREEARAVRARPARGARGVRSLVERGHLLRRGAAGRAHKAGTAALGVPAPPVGTGHRRCVTDRRDGLSAVPRSGRPRRLPDDKVAEVIKRSLPTPPPDAPH